MIEELSVVLRKQTPNPPNEWLYETTVIDGGLVKRNFVPFAYLGKNAEPWPECTDEEKVQWEEDHKPEPEPEPTPEPEPVEPEPTNKEE